MSYTAKACRESADKRSKKQTTNKPVVCSYFIYKII